MIKPIYLTHYATAVSTETVMVENIDFPQRVHYMPDTFRTVRTGMKHPAHLVAEKVISPEIEQYLQEVTGKTAFIFAAGNGSFAGLRNTLNAWNPCDYRFLALSLLQIYAGKVAQRLGKMDLITTDASACASSLKVLMDAQMLISVYGYERVVVLSAEDQVNEMILKFFGEARATLSKDAEDAGTKPSSFDPVNSGFNVGQGAVLAVFESTPSAGCVEMLGAFTASEQADSALGQRPDGEGFYKAAAQALDTAGVPASQVSIVKTHGTGTASNNVAEKAAIHRLLGTSGYVATSYKPRIGHTFGVSGLLESCLLFDDIRATGCVPEILNRTVQDAVFLSEPCVAPQGAILSLAAGMGNVYAAAVWRMPC